MVIDFLIRNLWIQSVMGAFRITIFKGRTCGDKSSLKVALIYFRNTEVLCRLFFLFDFLFLLIVYSLIIYKYLVLSCFISFFCLYPYKIIFVIFNVLTCIFIFVICLYRFNRSSLPNYFR